MYSDTISLGVSDMETISRSAARAKGQHYYFTGRPCRHGNVALRTVGNWSCTCDACRKHAIEKVRRYQAKVIAAGGSLEKNSKGAPSARAAVDPKTIRDIYDYCQETGRLSRRKPGPGARPGKPLGTIGADGYRRIVLGRRSTIASAVVWAWHYGEWPAEDLLRRNGDRQDDRIENLAPRTELRRPVAVCSRLSPEDQPENMLGDLPESLNTGIYEIRNAQNGRRYIGSAVNVSKRWREHLRQLDDGNHHNRFMQRCWNKGGGRNVFVFSVILVCRPADLITYEQIAIDSLRPQYNANPKAASMLGFRHSDETKRKLSASAKRTKNFTGRRHSEETKRLISEKKKGVKQYPGVVERRAESMRKHKGRRNAKKFDERQIRDIRSRCEAGAKSIDLAREYGVSDSVICEIKKRRSYRWVD